MNKKIKLLIITAAILLSVSLALIFINVYVVAATRGQIVGADVVSGEYDCILVLGAGLRPDGTPSDMLRDRLDTAIDLYERGACDTILLSGDRSGEDYDEVSAMKDYCLSRSVPEENIETDETGFSTYESLENAIDVHGYDDIIAVTQSYHLHRAIYIAEQMGAEVVGVSADVRSYRGQTMREVREIAARIKDFFVVNIMY